MNKSKTIRKCRIFSNAEKKYFSFSDFIKFIIILSVIRIMLPSNYRKHKQSTLFIHLLHLCKQLKLSNSEIKDEPSQL